MSEFRDKKLPSNFRGKNYFAENPNTIATTGVYELKVTQTESGISNVTEQTESLFSADSWMRTETEIQFMGSDFPDGSSTFNIELLGQFEMILTENIKITEFAFGFEFKTSGTRTFTFVR